MMWSAWTMYAGLVILALVWMVAVAVVAVVERMRASHTGNQPARRAPMRAHRAAA